MYSHRMELFFYENQILTRFCYNIDEVLFDLYVYARRCLVFKYKDYKEQVTIPVDRKYNRNTLLLCICIKTLKVKPHIICIIYYKKIKE